MGKGVSYWADTGCNVCGVDWQTLASIDIPYNNIAIDNVPRVAKHVAKFIRFLKSNGADVATVSMAGHSLGSHISGQTGYNLTTTGDLLRAIYGIRYILNLYNQIINNRNK